MSMTGDILEETGDTIECVLAGAIARYQRIELPGMTQDEFITQVVFELLCAMHNHATRAEIETVLFNRIHT